MVAAKSTLSARLLRAGVAGGVVGRRPALALAAAVASAGQNVHAVGVGRKLTNGKVMAERCIRIYVVQKMAKSVMPQSAWLPETIDGMPTDVIQSAPAYLAAPNPPCSQNKQKRQDPKVGGISVGHTSVTAGTLACFCRSTKAGDPADAVFALSNNHIFANVNKAAIGDPLLQPGALDGGTAADAFATLFRFQPITLGGQVGNKVDAAIGLLTGPGFKKTVCSIGAITGRAAPAEGLVIRKHGRTTGYREGTVTDVSYDALVAIDPSTGSVGLFDNQLRLTPRAPFTDIGLGGDSGSLVVTKQGRRAVGLYFANPPGGEYGIACPIGEVLTALEIALL
jgi:hypothetical protein